MRTVPPSEKTKEAIRRLFEEGAQAREDLRGGCTSPGNTSRRHVNKLEWEPVTSTVYAFPIQLTVRPGESYHPRTGVRECLLTPSAARVDLARPAIPHVQPVPRGVNSITASMLYDLVVCPHRVTLDLFGDPDDRHETNAFVRLLWERGTLYEKEVIEGLKAPFVDLSPYAGREKEQRTLEAMAAGEPLIYSARIQADDLLGDPDLLRREGGGYVPGDIKSGAGEEGPEQRRKPKTHYAVQLALYVDVLERKGLSGGRRGFVWDVHGEECVYDFTAPVGVRTDHTLWDVYQDCLTSARDIVQKSFGTRPAYSAPCKTCNWYTACLKRLQAEDDLTLIPDLGRSKRDAMLSAVHTIAEFAASDPNCFVSRGRTVFHEIPRWERRPANPTSWRDRKYSPGLIRTGR